jgi:hypothetical protein
LLYIGAFFFILIVVLLKVFEKIKFLDKNPDGNFHLEIRPDFQMKIFIWIFFGFSDGFPDG